MWKFLFQNTLKLQLSELCFVLFCFSKIKKIKEALNCYRCSLAAQKKFQKGSLIDFFLCTKVSSILKGSVLKCLNSGNMRPIMKVKSLAILVVLHTCKKKLGLESCGVI